MTDPEYRTTALRNAEAELDAATRRTDVNAAAKRLMLAKAELKRLAPRKPRFKITAKGELLPA
jgi:hypothetical protein